MSENSVFPKVLVISINAFSQGNSNNGKVLSQYFSDWKTDRIAQFYVMNEIPDSDFCKNYYRVTDKQALKSFLSLGIKKYGKKIELCEANNMQPSQFVRSSGKKTPLKRLIRDIVWDSGFWYSNDFFNWVDSFDPDILSY